MKAKENHLNFWDCERCEYCGGLIVEKKVTLHRRLKGKHLLVENVPAGVCRDCGAKYYAANVLKTVEQSIRGRRKKEVLVPVYSL